MVMDIKIISDKKEKINMNKKGRKINTVEIKTGKIMNAVTAFDDDGHVYKLTRSQRAFFTKDADYTDREILMQTFGNPDILSDQFRLVIDGEAVYKST
jgi:hypothetical protein